jgi:type I restriction enzyme S subunit
MKKYDSYKDSGVEWIGEVPENWEVSKVKFLFDTQKGKTPKNLLDKIEENSPVYLAMDYLRGEPKQVFFVSNNENVVLTDENETLLLWDGSNAGEFLKSKKGVLSSTMALIKSKIINNQFQWYSFKSFESILKDSCNGMGIPHVDGKFFRGSAFLVPPIEEQTVIAKYLDHKTTQIDHLIAKKEQFIQLLEEERVAVINQAVTKGFVPNVEMKDSGIEWLGDIPKHWEVKKLKQIFNSSKGLTITKENLESEGIPCVNYGEIHSKFGFEVDIDKHQLKCVNPTYLESDYKSLIQTGDFVFADTSEDVSGAGNFTYLKSNHEIFAGYHTIILRALVDIESRYFAYQFDSIPYRTQIRQSVKGIKVFSITQGILKNTSLWVPPIDEQKQIIEFLDIETNRIVSLKNSAIKEIELLKEFKTALISEVVTGKIDVRNEKLN